MIVNSGLGSSATTGLISSGVATAGGVVGAAASAGLLTTIGITAAAVPIIGPVVAGISLAIAALGIGAGCGQSCIASTNIVNAVEPYMRQNVSAANTQAQANAASNNGVACLTSAEQAQLAANFQTLWNQVLSQCGAVPAPGGTNCIADRQRGGKFDWFNAYLDPINQIPVCTPLATSGITSDGSVVASDVSSSGIPSSWFLLGGVALLVFGLMGGD